MPVFEYMCCGCFHLYEVVHPGVDVCRYVRSYCGMCTHICWLPILSDMQKIFCKSIVNAGHNVQTRYKTFSLRSSLSFPPCWRVGKRRESND